MNFLETVNLIFPGADVGAQSSACEFIELQRLPKGTVPQNCEVLASGQFQYSITSGPRNSYLAKAGQLVLMIRIFPDAFNSMSAQVSVRKSMRSAGSPLFH